MNAAHNVNFPRMPMYNGSLFASLSYLSNNGPIVGNKDVFDRITGTVNADYKVKDWLKFTTNNSFSRYHVQSVSEGSATGSLMLSAIQLDPLTPVTYTPDKLPDTMINYMNQGHTLLQNANGDYYSCLGTMEQVHPMVAIRMNDKKNTGNSLMGTLYANFTPIKDLVFTTRLGYRIATDNTYTHNNLYYGSASASNEDRNGVTRTSLSTTYYQWENFVNYNTTLLDTHNISAMLGMSYSQSDQIYVSAGVAR